MERNSLLATLVATALAMSSAGAAATEDTAPMQVQVDGATISVIANNAPLRDVLVELRDQAGFSLVKGSEPLQSPVTVELDGFPWPEGLAALLRGYRYALAMDPETNRPATLVILSSKVAELSGNAEGGAPEGSAELAASDAQASTAEEAVASMDEAARTAEEAAASMEEAARIADELIAQRENPLEHAMRQAREAAAKAAAAAKLPQGESGPDSERGYADSLRALGAFQDPDRLSVLDPALDSRSKDVRAAALDALRDGTVRDESVLSRVRSLITSDPDPSVRRGALEVYARYGSPAEVLALVQSLGRTSGAARDIAVREWLRIERELAEASQADQQLRR